MTEVHPRYPVYVISKGRATVCKTADVLVEDGVDFRLVVEPQEADAYAAVYGDDRLLVTPFSELGQGSIPVRNFVWEHSTEDGFARHWVLDDNILRFRRLYKGKRIPVSARIALRACEDFTDRYTNIGIAGLNYEQFVMNETAVPYYLNVHVYSCLLIRNDMPYRWRGRYNEDTDLCLQVLSGGLCTVLLNAFMANKMQTMVLKGGNTDELYAGDGRTRMSRSLERVWPGVVETKRRFDRPQHFIRDSWRKFDTPLIRRDDVDWNNLAPNDYGMKLVQVKPEIKSARIKAMLDEAG